MAWLALFPITSVDAYYHLATGRRILADRAIPARGVGSATRKDAAWHDNEWGFQAIAAAIGRTERDPDGVVVLTPAGRAGLILLRAGALAATLALLSAQLRRASVGLVGRALAVWLAAFLMFGNLFWDIRPQILSYLAFAAIAYALERARSGSVLALASAVAIVGAWANVHGAFVLGIGLIACEAAGAWLEAVRGQGPKRAAWRLTAAAALSPAAACVNPLGVAQLTHPFLYMARPEIFAGNNEWSRPDLTHLPLLDLTVVVLAAALIAGARPRAGLLLRAAVFGAMFLTAIRHLPFAALTLVPLTAVALSGIDPARRPRVLTRAWLPAAAAVAIVALSGAKFIGLRPRFAERPSRPLPEREVRFLARAGVGGSGFNAYRFGGFLMLRLYPRKAVFMDGRNDLYGAFRSEVYEPILAARPGWQEMLREAVARYDVRWVLIDGTEPLAAALADDPGWRRVGGAELGGGEREADGIVLFVRAGS